jgi:myb-related protein
MGWSQEEDVSLKEIITREGAKNWKKIAQLLSVNCTDSPKRTDAQCRVFFFFLSIQILISPTHCSCSQNRWRKVLAPGLVKGPWTVQEDTLLKDLIRGSGARAWNEIARHLPGRIGKQVGSI